MTVLQTPRYKVDNWDEMMMKRDEQLTGHRRGQSVSTGFFSRVEWCLTRTGCLFMSTPVNTRRARIFRHQQFMAFGRLPIENRVSFAFLDLRPRPDTLFLVQTNAASLLRRPPLNCETSFDATETVETGTHGHWTPGSGATIHSAVLAVGQKPKSCI